jgi:hypothetical protein
MKKYNEFILENSSVEVEAPTSIDGNIVNILNKVNGFWQKYKPQDVSNRSQDYVKDTLPQLRSKLQNPNYKDDKKEIKNTIDNKIKNKKLSILSNKSIEQSGINIKKTENVRQDAMSAMEVMYGRVIARKYISTIDKIIEENPDIKVEDVLKRIWKNN